MFAVTKQAGQCAASVPDMCIVPVPSPSGPVPTPMPFPNLAMPMMGNPATLKVLIAGSPALTKASKISISSGDEAGSLGGVVSGTIDGVAEFVTSSATVKLEGNFAVKLSDMTKQNGGNTVGAVIAPSQTVVMIMS